MAQKERYKRKGMVQYRKTERGRYANNKLKRQKSQPTQNMINKLKVKAHQNALIRLIIRLFFEPAAGGIKVFVR